MARLIPRPGRRGRATLIAALLVGAGLLLTLGSLAWDAAGKPSAPTVALPAPTATGVPIRPGFLGLSFEFEAVRAYTGSDAAAINPVLVQLIRNLTPGQRPSLRIGGDSSPARMARARDSAEREVIEPDSARVSITVRAARHDSSPSPRSHH